VKCIRDVLERDLLFKCDEHAPGVALRVLQAGEEVLTLTRGLARLEGEVATTARTAFDAGSIAKTVTGICIAMLEAEGKLALNAGIRDFLPELPEHLAGVTLEHLLRHESGLHDYSTMLYFMSGWHPHEPPTSQQVLETLGRAPGPKWEPGSRYEYADTNYFLLGRVVERVADEALGTFAMRRVFEPLGMINSFMTDCAPADGADVAVGYTPYPIRFQSPHSFRSSWERGWHPVVHRYRHTGAEGFRTCAADLAVLGQELLHPSVVDEKTMSRVAAPSRVRNDGLGYGYGLNAGTYRGLQFLGHDGMIQGFTASLSVFPEYDLVIACLTNREDLGAWGFRDCVLRELLGVAPSPGDSHLLCLSGPWSEPRAGRFLDIETGSFLELSRDDGDLQASVNGERPQPATYEACACEGPEVVDLLLGGKAQAFMPFVESASKLKLEEYAGKYECAELQTVFHVEATQAGIRLTNADRGHPSMDLDYTPTIPDFFWSHDPHPGISQLEFAREQGRVVAFRYRDYDGDGREAFLFVRS